MASKTVLITGASSGIGYEFAKCFAHHHFNLVLVARNEKRLETFAQALRKAHDIQVTVIVKDLSQPHAPTELYEELQKQGISVDILINNAGLGNYGLFSETDLATDLEMLHVNIVALTHLTKQFLPHMIQQRDGKILNVASTAAFQPGPLMAVYYASKAYVLSFTEALANELAGTGVTATALCPGLTETEFQKRANLEESKLMATYNTMTAATVAEIGYEALMAGKSIVILGTLNKLMAWGTRFLPRKTVTRIVRSIQESSKISKKS